ncbi:MAG: hypothetical protein GY760_13295, partial [Deltaproteobacteria bacterium]|nr:hypothetical protein [Deltaproteobacteria bacterium]
YIDFMGEEHPYQLKTVNNGIGLTTTFDYKSSVKDMQTDRDSGTPWTNLMPFPIPVLSKTVVNDGLNDYVTKFFYHNGYFSIADQEFRGFAKAEQLEIGDTSAPDLISQYIFDTGQEFKALRGKTLEHTLKNSSNEIFKKDIFSWECRELLSGIDPGESRKVYFPFVKEKLTEITEKGFGTPVQLKWEYEYDNYGNLTKETSHGRLGDGWNDERIVESTYSASYPSGLSNWILNVPVETTTKDFSDTTFAHKIYYYDKSEKGFVSKGNLTETRDWVESDKYVISERKDYDDYGNVIAIYDPLYGTDAGHYRQIEYDTTYNTFPEKEHAYTGVLTLSISVDYDYGFGAITSSKDYNSNITSYGYDTFGRKSWIQKPLDTEHTEEYEYVLARSLPNNKIINWIETRKRDGSSDGFLKSRTFFDGMNRKIMTRSEGETDDQIVVSDTQLFNSRGQAKKKYLPYFDTGTLDFVEPTYQTGFTEHFYDALGREVKFIQPGGAFSLVIYAPMSKTVQDEEQTDISSKYYGCGKRYVEDGLLDKDGKGRLREVFEIVKISDAGEAQASIVEWKTRYLYDILNNLTEHVDSKDNTKIFSYDGLSRKTYMNDPDRGQMFYTFDDAGNLISTLDAKNQTVKYKYDGVNRLVQEFYGKEKTVADIEYHYDTPRGEVSKGELFANAKVTAVNTLGYLTWVKDLSGEEHNSYDKNGRVSWVVKSINNSSLILKNYYNEYQYDSMDRIVKTIYPDQTFASYTYNKRGLLESVPNVITSLDYNPSGQNKELKYANGTVTNYTYDHRLRLQTLKTSRARDNLSLQDLTYSYDNISNITGITDNRTNSTLETIGQDLSLDSVEALKFNSTQNFQYDSLYRLTKAYNINVYGAIDYRTDRIGNMINKSATLLTPDPLMDLGVMTIGGTAGSSSRFGREFEDQPGPHAITGTSKGKTGPMAFTYDANGNMTFERGMTFGWDFKDRLTAMIEGTKQAFYKYDYTGTRKHKYVTDSASGINSEAIYIDKNSEVRKGSLIKYIYAGTLKIGKSTVQNSSETAFVPENYFLYDHLGSASITLDSSENVAEQFSYYPFGKLRLSKKSGEDTIADYKFTGKERDAESDLDYFEMRYYSSTLMRFNRVDPLSASYPENWIGDPQQLNFYSYCRNNPIILVDPSGMAPNSMTANHRPLHFVDPAGGTCGRMGGGGGGLILAFGKAIRYFGKEIISIFDKKKEAPALTNDKYDGYKEGLPPVPEGSKKDPENSTPPKKVKSGDIKDFLESKNISIKNLRYHMEKWRAPDGTLHKKHYWKNSKGRTFYHLRSKW